MILDTNNYFKKAKSIWAENRSTEMNMTLTLIGNFPKSENAELIITGSSYYNIFVNGEFLALGPARAAHEYYRVDKLPLKFNKENNEVRIIVMGYNVNSFYHLDQPSFICAEIEIEGETIAYTDVVPYGFSLKEWKQKVQKVQRYSFQRPFAEVYDFTRETYADVKAEYSPSKNFLPRNVFYGGYEKENTAKIIQRGTFTQSEKEKYYADRSVINISDELKGFTLSEFEVFSAGRTQKIDAQITKKEIMPYEDSYIAGNSFITYEMDRNLTGLIGFTYESFGENEIIITFDEIMQGDNVNFIRQGAANVIIIKAGKETRKFLSVEPYTYKYIRIFCKGDGMLVKDLHLRRVSAPPVDKYLDSKNEKLLKIFDAAVETYRQNTFDIFMDCPSRERAGWLCDSFFTARVEKILTGNSEIEKNFIENFLLPESFKDLPDGLLPMCYPADHYDKACIINWSMWFVIELKEYLERTNDHSLIEKAKVKVYKMLNYFKKFENEYGLLEKLDKTVFIEWSRSNELVQDVSFPTNMLYSRMKQTIADLYGDKACAKEAEELKNTIRKMSYTDEGFFCDNAYRKETGLELSMQYSESCQYYAFHTGVATPELYPELWQRLVDDFGFDRRETKKWSNIYFANAFIGNYLRLDLLAMYEDKNIVLKNIEDYFYYMAEKTGTLWENVSDNASCNHGFASHVIYWFDKFGMIK